MFLPFHTLSSLDITHTFDSHKLSMWAKIGEELKVPWHVAEDMHWILGPVMRAERAGVPLSSQAVDGFLPPQAHHAEGHQHRDQEDDLTQKSPRHPRPSLSQTETASMTHEGQPGGSNAVTLPSFADLTAGVEL